MVVAIGQLNAAGVQLFLASYIYSIDASLLGQTRATISTNLWLLFTRKKQLKAFLSFTFHKE